MNNITSIGRWIGASMLLTFAIGMLSNFKFQAALFGGEGLLVNAGAHPLQIGAIALAGLIGSLLSVWVASVLWVHGRACSPVLATGYFAIVVAGLTLSMIEYGTLIAFRSLSESFAAAGADQAALYDAPKAALAGLRNGLHYLDKLLGGIGVLAFFALLLRARWIPGVLGVLGMLAAVSQMIAVGRGLFGFDVLAWMLAPLALMYVVTLVWLLIRGFPGNGQDAPRAAPKDLLQR